MSIVQPTTLRSYCRIHVSLLLGWKRNTARNWLRRMQFQMVLSVCLWRRWNKILTGRWGWKENPCEWVQGSCRDRGERVPDICRGKGLIREDRFLSCRRRAIPWMSNRIIRKERGPTNIYTKILRRNSLQSGWGTRKVTSIYWMRVQAERWRWRMCLNLTVQVWGFIRSSTIKFQPVLIWN
jgi:hypothetical protein